MRSPRGVTCLAYGAHLNLAELVFVNSAAAVLSGLIPVPGGIGAAEAAFAAGLIAVGVDQSTAFAVAITQRLCTFYLPPIWGYISLRWSATTATSELQDRQRLSSGRVAVPSEQVKSTSTTHETSNTEDAAPCQVTTDAPARSSERRARSATPSRAYSQRRARALAGDAVLVGNRSRSCSLTLRLRRPSPESSQSALRGSGGADGWGITA